MALVKETSYTVQRGDTLVSIAKKHRISSWKSIYEAPANKDFRRTHPNPNLIHPGDKLKIPPDALSVAQARLEHLEKLKKESLDFFRQQEKELKNEFGKVQKTAQTIDTAATVASILVNLGGLVKSAHKALGLTGKQLAEANQALLRTHVSNNVQTAAGMAGSSMTITGEEGLVWGMTKVLLKSWSDMWSPSYWAKKWVGVSPDKAYREAQDQLTKTRDSITTKLEEKIRDTQKLISQLKQEKNVPLPRR